ncbi:MAG: DNA primase, partial [Actinomycetales bacterium]|nr:DNA primase [Actinomycetales bacterium]
IRRIMGDDSGLGEVIFTFDPDAAGQKAAMRAFAEEQRFAAQTFVAVAPEGLDPCDLRLARGEQAVRDLMDAKVPMFEFVIRQMLKNYNLDTVEGRVAALREAAPVVADIRDSALRPGYTRELARLTGVDVSEAQVAVSNAVKASRSKGMQTTSEGARQGYAGPATARPAGAPGTPEDPASIAPAEPEGPRVFELKNDPSTRLERDAMMALIQYPELVGLELAADAVQSAIMDANLATVRDAIGANVNELGGETWLDRIQNDLPQDFKPLVTQLAVAPLPQKNAEQTQSYCRGVVISLIERDLVRRKSELVGRLQRTSVDQGEVSREIQRELLELETKRRSLRED